MWIPLYKAIANWLSKGEPASLGRAPELGFTACNSRMVTRVSAPRGLPDVSHCKVNVM